MISLRNLAIFVAIAETGSVSRAAHRVNTVQSNVTARLKDLEGQFGAALFHRSAKGMTLTAAGEVLLGHAKTLLQQADAATRAVREAADGGGLLRIGAMETTSAVRLPPVLKRFHEAFPRTEIRLTAGPTEVLLQAVLACRLDAAFVGGMVDHADIVGEPVFRERLVQVRRRPPADRTDRPAAEETAIVVFRTGCSYRARTEQWLRDQGRLPFHVMELGTLDGILGCVAAGLGTTLLPESVVAGSVYAEDLDVQPIPDRIGLTPTYFVRRRDVPVGKALNGLLGLLRDWPADAKPSADITDHDRGSRL